MKTPFTRFLITVILINLFNACKGPQGSQGPIGPQGVQGEKGDKGDKGATGDIGVQQITYTDKRNDLPNDLLLPLPDTMSTSTIEKSMFYVYVKQTQTINGVSNSYWFPIPGEILNGNRYTFYIHPGNATTKGGVFLRRTVNFQDGGDTFQVVRVLIIPASMEINARRAAVDFSNYEEVRKTFGLPE